ncbi:MAG: hypothetical protein ABJ239_12285 [Erythrobacter sp.]
MTKRWPMWLGLLLGMGALALPFALTFAVQIDWVTQWQLAARWTSRVGFPLLMLAYVARPLVQIWNNKFSKALLGSRKYFGLGFALSHTVHLFALILYLQISGEPAPVATLYGGGAGYVIMYAMAFTSNRTSMKALGVWWKRLHSLGIHTLWFIYLVSYLGRLFDPDTRLLGVLTVAILAATGAIRLSAWLKTRRKRARVRAT